MPPRRVLGPGGRRTLGPGGKKTGGGGGAGGGGSSDAVGAARERGRVVALKKAEKYGFIKREAPAERGERPLYFRFEDCDCDASRLRENDDVTFAASDAPELIALTKELTKNLDEVTRSVEPVIAAARAGELATAEGISYLDAKHLLMLSYCINIVFYLLLKSEGRSVRDHPVVLRLVEIRAYLEKLRPIDRKLRYQIDKLLKTSAASELAGGEDDGEDEDDPLRFKPNPDALVGGADAEDAEALAGGAYRPPKMVPTAMDDFEEGGKSAKQKRKEKEARRRASRSALIKVRRFSFDPTRGFFLRLGASRFSRCRDRGRAPLNFLVLRRAFVGDAVPWRSKATIFRGTERTYQILGRVPPSTPWATIQSRAGQSFFSFLFFSHQLGALDVSTFLPATRAHRTAPLHRTPLNPHTPV